MREIKIYQKPLSELIKVVFISHPVDLGKFSVRILEDIILEHKNEFDFQFDEIKIYPSQQPRESGDIELFYKNKVVRRISVKTDVAGNLKRTFKKILKDLRRHGQDGMLVTFYTCEKEKNIEDVLLILVYMPQECLFYNAPEVFDEIQYKFDEKANREKCKKLRALAVNEAIQFEMLYKAVVNEEIAREARDTAREARDTAKKAKEMAEEAYKEAHETKKMVKQILDILKKRNKEST